MFSAGGKSAVTSGYNLTNSLRFRSSAIARLSRTFGTPTNTSTWTLSAWIKRGDLSPATASTVLASRPASTTTAIYFNPTGNLVFWNNEAVAATSTAIFRDPSAWYHLVVSSNGTTTIAYINNSSILSWTGDLALINNSGTHYIGHAATTGARDFDGYMTEINFVDGQALTPSSFGVSDGTTGVWRPRDYTGTYGTNGFHLNFADNSAATAAAIGKDISGNGNNWTPNNISLTAGATYDSMTDVPTLTSATAANYCTANPLDASPSGTSVLSNGNLTVNVSGSSAGGGFGGQARVNTINFTNVSGKWYWEAFVDNAGTGAATSRLTFFMAAEPINISGQGGPFTWSWRADGLLGTVVNAGTFATNDVVMFAYDSDTGKIWLGKNGTWTNSGVPASGTGNNATLTALASYALGLNYGTSGGGTGTASFNFGQRPFAYTPPTGFNRINTFNLPTSTIVKGDSVMDATTYTGNGASPRSITNAASFRPDFVWIKNRGDGAVWHILNDSNRGANRNLFSNTTNAEVVDDTAGYLSAFNSNGFSVTAGSASFTNCNTNTNNYVAWQWQAGQGSTSSNTTGTIPSTVSVNATAGFSVVTYTGTGANATVGHGLGVAPSMVIVKRRNNTGNWQVRHTSITAANSIQLNSQNAPASATTVWNSTAPSSTVFSVGTSTDVNANAGTYVAYCWATIAGFSAFGSYTGNGNADGPFVYLGFRPKFIIWKNISTTSNWVMEDSARNSFNVTNLILISEASTAESTGTSTSSITDFLSNGFKLRGSGGTANGNGQTSIYMAFAENPFKNSLAR